MSTATNLGPSNSLRAAQSAYGDVDIRAGVPTGLVHLASSGASRVCSRLGVEFARAIVGFRTSRYGSSPQFKGIVVVADDAARISPATSRVSNGARTDRELAMLGALGFDELSALSIRSLHALNRRAKRYPAKAAEIYRLKSRYLRAAVLAGVAKVERFTVQRLTGYLHFCDCFDGEMGRSWYSRTPESYCHACGDDSFGEPQRSSRVWYLVRLLGHSFHQPGPTDPKFDAVALPTQPHDPTNHNTEVPKIGLTIAAQRRCVEMVSTIWEGESRPCLREPTRKPL